MHCHNHALSMMFSTFTLPRDKIWYLILYLGTLYGNRLYVWLSHHFGQTKQKLCGWTQLLKHVSVTHPYMYIREPGSWKCRNEILNTSEMIQKQLSNKGKPDSFVKWQKLILVLCMTWSWVCVFFLFLGDKLKQCHRPWENPISRKEICSQDQGTTSWFLV